MPRRSRATSAIRRLAAACEISMSDFGLVCWEAGIRHVSLRLFLETWDLHITADFDRFESHPAVVAGLVPATPRVRARSQQNGGGRDKPGHDSEKNRSHCIIA